MFEYRIQKKKVTRWRDTSFCHDSIELISDTAIPGPVLPRYVRIPG